MAALKTPGVYIAEKSAFPNSVVEPATAVTAFVGWTERAERDGQSVHLKPVRITSSAEYVAVFGGSPLAEHTRFTLSRAAGATETADGTRSLGALDATAIMLGGESFRLAQTAAKYNLYFAMLHFFENGGSDCYVVSVGRYGDAISADALSAGIEALTKEFEPTIVVAPEAVLLSQQACYTLQRKMLSHCGAMRNRVAILDAWEGYRARADAPDVVSQFREGIGSDDLSYGAAYYPWLHTAMVQPDDISVRNFDDDSRRLLLSLIKHEIVEGERDDRKRAAIQELLNEALVVSDAASAKGINRALSSVSALFQVLCAEMARRVNLLPPSAAIAGVYAQVDNVEGVWNAPANVFLNNVMQPAVVITDQAQGDLNAPIDGKSINAIRSFVGRGTLVWGARTLDGNSQEWRYINVRRTCICLEQAIAGAMKAFAFEPNTSATWIAVRSMISSYLHNVWLRGGLMGSKPEDAFSVQIGPGESMTADEVASGLMRANVLVAITRPSEFIVLKFAQRLKTT